MFDERLLADVLTAAKYVKMPLEYIVPAPYNPRVDLTPDDPEYQDIKRSILDHGLMQPIVYNERTHHAAGGNQRLKVLRDMGIKEATCAVINVSMIQEMQINVALNRLGNLWDQPKLREIMLDLQERGYEMSRTAFTQDEVDKITQDMTVDVSDFFMPDDEEVAGNKQKTQHTYKCPHCGEVFTV